MSKGATAPDPEAYRGLVFFAIGLRPFFLGAPIYTTCAILIWLALYFGRLTLEGNLANYVWHAHEMLFGYSCAVLAGFFLTVLPSWTDTLPIRDTRLAVLFAVWLAGRVALWASPVLPAALVAGVDLAFLMLLVIYVGPPLVQSKGRHNLIFIPLLGLLMGANFLVHLEALGVGEGVAVHGLYLAVDTLVLILSMIGGRIIPAFTKNALEATGRSSRIIVIPKLNSLALGSLSIVVVADLILPSTIVSGVALLAAAALNFARLACWRSLATLGQPIVWVLHLAYLWLVVGLAIRGIADVMGILVPSLALHVLIIGAFGTMTMGFMTRASLGPTGHQPVAPPIAVAGYLFVTLAALLRVGMPLIDSGLYDLSVALSGLCWAAGFGAISVMVWPILTRPRPDGQPG